MAHLTLQHEIPWCKRACASYIIHAHKQAYWLAYMHKGFLSDWRNHYHRNVSIGNWCANWTKFKNRDIRFHRYTQRSVFEFVDSTFAFYKLHSHPICVHCTDTHTHTVLWCHGNRFWWFKTIHTPTVKFICIRSETERLNWEIVTLK